MKTTHTAAALAILSVLLTVACAEQASPSHDVSPGATLPGPQVPPTLDAPTRLVPLLRLLIDASALSVAFGQE